MSEYVNENQNFIQNNLNPISRIVSSNSVLNSKVIIEENQNSNYLLRFRAGDSDKQEAEYLKTKQIVSSALKNNSKPAEKKINEILRSYRFLSDGSLMNFLKECLNNPDLQQTIKYSLASSFMEIASNNIEINLNHKLEPYDSLNLLFKPAHKSQTERIRPMTIAEFLQENRKTGWLEKLPLEQDFELRVKQFIKSRHNQELQKLRAQEYEAGLKSGKIETSREQSPRMRYSSDFKVKPLKLETTELKTETEVIPNLLKNKNASSKKHDSIFFQGVDAFSVPRSNNFNTPHDSNPNYLPLDSSDKINSPTPQFNAPPIRRTEMRPGNKVVRFEGPVVEPIAFKPFDPGLSLADTQTMLDDLPQIIEYKHAEKILADSLGPRQNPRMHYFDDLKKYGATYYTMVKKIYHLGESGLPLESYGVTDSQLAYLQKYVNRGGKLPNEDCLRVVVKTFQDFFDGSFETVNVDAAFQGERATILYNKTNNGVMILRDSETTKILWTTFELNSKQKVRYLREGSLGIHNKTAIPEGTKPQK